MSNIDELFKHRWSQMQQQQLLPFTAPSIPSQNIDKIPVTEEGRISAKYDILILREVNALTDKELVSLHKMITSVDYENFVVATEIIKQKFDNYKYE